MRVNLGDILDDLRPLRRIVDLKIADDVNQHFQFDRAGRDGLGQLLGLGHFGQLIHLRPLVFDLLGIGRQ